jgi:hypothetical protein
MRRPFGDDDLRTARNVDGGTAVRFGTNHLRMLGLVVIAANLTCCSGARFTPGDQQDVSQECGPMRQRLTTDQTLTPAQAAEITKNMEKAGCARRLPGP